MSNCRRKVWDEESEIGKMLHNRAESNSVNCMISGKVSLVTPKNVSGLVSDRLFGIL